MSLLYAILELKRPPLRHVAADEELPLATPIRARGRRPQRICLATEHVRLCLLPWSGILKRHAHWTAFARSRFEQLHGLPIEQWSVHVVDEPPPRPRLAVAVPGDLLAKLGIGTPHAVAGEVRVELLQRLSALLAKQPQFDGIAIEVGLRGATVTALRGGDLLAVRQRPIDSTERAAGDRTAAIVGALLPVLIAEQATAALASQPVLVAAADLALQGALCEVLRSAGMAAEAWSC